MIKGKQQHYYNMGFVFAALAIGCIDYDNIVLTKVIPEICECGSFAKNMPNSSDSLNWLTGRL